MTQVKICYLEEFVMQHFQMDISFALMAKLKNARLH